jgi:DnaJ-class molecular chaperone
MSYPATGTSTDLRRCPTCDGTGINPVATYMLCPKCNGEKWIPHKQPRFVR